MSYVDNIREQEKKLRAIKPELPISTPQDVSSEDLGLETRSLSATEKAPSPQEELSLLGLTRVPGRDTPDASTGYLFYL